jgi:hypothetical protein
MIIAIKIRRNTSRWFNCLRLGGTINVYVFSESPCPNVTLVLLGWHQWMGFSRKGRVLLGLAPTIFVNCFFTIRK